MYYSSFLVEKCKEFGIFLSSVSKWTKFLSFLPFLPGDTADSYFPGNTDFLSDSSSPQMLWTLPPFLPTNIENSSLFLSSRILRENSNGSFFFSWCILWILIFRAALRSNLHILPVRVRVFTKAAAPTRGPARYSTNGFQGWRGRRTH